MTEDEYSEEGTENANRTNAVCRDHCARQNKSTVDQCNRPVLTVVAEIDQAM